MKKSFLLIICVLCFALSACVSNVGGNVETPDTTPGTTEPEHTPGTTVIPPSETPVEIIDPVDPSEGPVILPVETPSSTPKPTPAPTPTPTTVVKPGDTPASTPEATPTPTPETTPTPTPEETAGSTSSGIDLPWIPVGPM